MPLSLSSKPLVTIIMPIRNEAAYIERSLGSVLAQDYPAHLLQILVVDGLSTDATRDLVQQFAICHPQIAIYLLDNPARIVPTALNIGLTHAIGEVIVRVDGHCEISPDYISRCVELLADRGVECIGGAIETIGETTSARTIAVAMSSPFGVGGAPFRVGQDREVEADTLAFGAYTREAIDRCGPFDEELVRNQDDEFNYRLRKLGGRILLAPQIRSKYYSRGTLPQLWRQYTQYGFWKVLVLQKHPQQMQPRQFAPPLLVAGLLFGGLLAPFSVIVRRLWIVLLCAYTLANGLASIVTAARRGWRHLTLLPMVFATLHLGYGLGFLAGLIRFANRWRSLW